MTKAAKLTVALRGLICQVLELLGVNLKLLECDLRLENSLEREWLVFFRKHQSGEQSYGVKWFAAGRGGDSVC